MKYSKLDNIAWDKLIKNKLYLFSLLFIIFCFLISVFAPILSPDKTPMANDMNIELAVLDPLTEVMFMCIPKEVNKVSLLKRIFIGSPLSNEKTPISYFEEKNNKLIYKEYKSEKIKEYIGTYEIKKKKYYLGTDKYGRDLLSRILYGARISFSIGFISVFISLVIGVSLGVLAGYFKGRIDYVVMWFINVVWSIPTLLMVIAITLALGKGFWQVFIAVGLTMWVEVARVVRGQVLLIRESEYVEAGKVLAFKPFRIIFKHVVPNILSPVIVISAANFAAAILIESGLSFLGLGAQPPIPSWGSMIKDHYTYIIMDKAFLACVPGISIMLLVLSFMILGNGLRDILDIKS